MDFLFLLLSAEFGLLALMFAPALVGGAMVRRAQYARAERWFSVCHRASRMVRPWRANTALSLCVCHTYMGDFVEALPYAEEAVREYGRQKGMAFYHHIAQAYLGINLTNLGQYERADAIFKEILASNSLRSRLRTEVEGCAAAGLINQGRLEEAEAMLRKVLEAQPSQDTLVLAESNLSVCHYFRNEYEEALKVAKQAAGRPVRWGWVRLLAQSNCLLYLSELGRIEEARTLEAEIRPIPDELPSFVRAALLRALATLALRAGDLDRARMYAEQALPLALSPTAQASALMIQAEVFAARHNAGRTLALCKEAVRLSRVEFHKRRAVALLQILDGGEPPVVRGQAVQEDTPEQPLQLRLQLEM